MAKVQGKKAAVTAKKATVKAAPPKAAAKKKAAAKPAAKPSPKPKAKAAPKAKAVVKKVVKAAAKATKGAAKAVAKSKPAAKAKAIVKAVKKPAAKVVAKAAAKVTPKAAAKPAPKGAPKTAAKPAAKAGAKPAPKTAAAPKVAPKPASKAAAKPAAKVVAAKPAAPVAAPKPAAAKVDDKKRVRRPRSRITSSGTAVATWFTQGDRPRPSSFIPAPPRAEAPSLIAAPPASSDRLVSHDELTEFVVRTVPVRVDIEQGAGRIYLNVNPLEVILRAGEGIEWDFRYLGGADIVVDDLIIDFEKPAPFAAAPFRSKRPGSNRPHRQLSGPVLPAAVGKKNTYAIRALNMYKTELASTRLTINVLA